MERLSPGVDTSRFFPGCGGELVRKRLDIPADAPVVVCTARMVRRKGQDTLIRVWPDVLREHPGARLLLVGDGPDRRRVERLVRNSGVSDSVIFTGSVPWREVPAYTDAGDVFAMPCRTRLFGLEPEAWGIVFLEAQACGLPVVIGRSGGAPEALLDGAPGEVVSRPAEVRDALVSLMDRRRRPGARASLVSSRESWSAASATLADLLL
jgi:phosphatidylinositol alpha-1,6-mannosyltransferase